MRLRLSPQSNAEADAKRALIDQGFNEAAAFAAEQPVMAGVPTVTMDASMRLRLSPQSNSPSAIRSAARPAIRDCERFGVTFRFSTGQERRLCCVHR